MKKQFIKICALLLATTLCLTPQSISRAAKVAGSTNGLLTEYTDNEGRKIEKYEFTEAGEYAAIIRITSLDGTAEVKAINGKKEIIINDTGSFNHVVAHNNNQTILKSITYPRYTPYWSAGYEKYSSYSVNATIAFIAATIAAGCGMPLDEAYNNARDIYNVLNHFSKSIYYTTFRFYATLEQGPESTIWYNKFITYTYSDSARTHQITSYTSVIQTGAPL